MEQEPKRLIMFLNWNRPVRWVHVKQYDQPIAVDLCCADIVQYIDSLPHTQTASCCCGHGEHIGHVEFRSSLPEESLRFLIGNNIERISWQNRGEMKGWWFPVKCTCQK